MKCPFCEIEQEDNWNNALPKSSIYREYSSVYEKTKKKEGHSYIWANCTNCNIGLLITDSKKKILGFNNPKIKYNEPEQHFAIVWEYLENLIGKKQDIKLSGKSKKDDSLISYIENKIQSTEKKLRETKKKNILIARRYMEHITGNISIKSELMNNLKENDILIIETLNFEKMKSRGNLSFMWDERISYPSNQYIVNYFDSQNMYCEKTINFENNDEPFTVFIFTKKENSSRQNRQIKDKKEDFRILKESLNKQILKKLNSAKDIYFYGINNKVMTAISIMLEHKYAIERISMYDNDTSKIDSEWMELKIKNIDEAEIAGGIHIFSFSNALSESLVYRLMNSGKRQVILNTNDLYKDGNRI